MIIGLIGLAGSGKDTVAPILQRVLAEQGMTFHLEKYATPLKLAAKGVFGANFDDRDRKEVVRSVSQDLLIEETFRCLNTLGFTDDEHAQASSIFFDIFVGSKVRLSPRQYQQVLGTEIVRSIRPSAWVDRVRSIQGKNLIITDSRFENEVNHTNLLICRHANIDMPKHPSEHLAWKLQFTGKTLPVDVFRINNEHPTTLQELEDRIRLVVPLIKFKEVI